MPGCPTNLPQRCGPSCAPAIAPCPLPKLSCVYGTTLYSTTAGRLSSGSTVLGCQCQGGNLVTQHCYSVATTCYGKCGTTDAGVVVCND